MPRLLFALCIVIVLALFLVLPYRIKRFSTIMHRFDTPDRALAFFALFSGLTILVQQATNYPFGLVYQLSEDKAREIITGTGLHSIYQGIGVVVGIIYWLLAVCVLFAVASLIRGTVRDVRSGGTPATSQDAQEEKQSIINLTERIDKYMEQGNRILENQTKILERLEARQNVSGNTTTTK